ncbi:uncharacterized protein LOC142823203 [Pelodiscus sinensis]|uniref:uncharacterized protein LOC142823203 n=1 Tax=Pelodiscus sinensis TaxID=13735 RepID=UPI003F6AF944
MRRAGVFAVLLSLAAVLDGPSAHKACLNVPPEVKTVSEGSTVSIFRLNTTNITETSFFVQKYNSSTLQWENVIYASSQGTQKLLSSFKETFSFSGGDLRMEHVSQDAVGEYKIQDHMTEQCVAIINVTLVEPSSSLPLESRITREPHHRTNRSEPGLWNFVQIPGAVAAAVVLLFVWLICQFMKYRRTVSAYLQAIFTKLTHFWQHAAATKQPGSAQNSQERDECSEV